MPIEYKDMGLEDIVKNMALVERLDIQIGYIGSDGTMTHPDSNISVATLAAMMEFGTDEIPARSYLRSTMLDQQAAIANLWAEALQDIIIKGTDPLEAFSTLGKSISFLVLQKFDRAGSWAKPLDSSTIKAKGSNTPLVGETQTLRKNLGWAVTKDGAIVRQGKAI